jgi:NADP-dependent 3-hydroxy acid dehydrogenase YdfG
MYPGVALANVSADGHLEVRYDASRIGFEEIEQILNEAGLARPTNLASRIKSGWFRFTDDNVRANAHATHTCCSRPPVSPG